MRHIVLFICLLVANRSEAQLRHFPCGNFADPIDTITCVANHTGAPAGALYGIWAKETSKLREGWRVPQWKHTRRGRYLEHSDWYRSASLAVPGGECFKRYPKKPQRCVEHWWSLKAMCKQRRNGVPICNADEVYTSYAFAAGPTQHMPAEILKWYGDHFEWTEDAVDGDNDGVVDLHSLADAMAMTAVQLVRYKQQAPDGTWRWAVNRYYGSQHAWYYDGHWENRRSRQYRFGVREHWQKWCQEIGCKNQRVQYAVLDDPK